jgi:hypothetical protein
MGGWGILVFGYMGINRAVVEYNIQDAVGSVTSVLPSTCGSY